MDAQDLAESIEHFERRALLVASGRVPGTQKVQQEAQRLYEKSFGSGANPKTGYEELEEEEKAQWIIMAISQVLSPGYPGGGTPDQDATRLELMDIIRALGPPPGPPPADMRPPPGFPGFPGMTPRPPRR